jgi:hypothetical protein
VLSNRSNYGKAAASSSNQGWAYADSIFYMRFNVCHRSLTAFEGLEIPVN